MSDLPPEQKFQGYDRRACGEHRTAGGRAWCFECGEWCYPSTPCHGCAIAALTPGRHVIYHCLDSFPALRLMPATVCRVADPLTTGVTPVSIRLRGGDAAGKRIWVADSLLELDL